MENIVIKKSKNGFEVPVFNGIHLHSIYAPDKEAEDFVVKNKAILDENKSFVIFGLGFGYHIEAVQKYLKKRDSEPNILVIEPSNLLVRKFFGQAKLRESLLAKIVSREEPQSLYEDEFVINFLVQRPGVLYHAPSYQLHKKYFEQFEKFQSSSKVEDIVPKTKSRFLIEELNELSPDQEIEEYLSSKISDPNQSLSRFDFFIGALETIVGPNK